MTKISIIIPVYNAENYIEKCLDSIFNQTFQDFEIICINDGSTDNSLKILQQFANDNRLKIINKKNEGVSIARNTGIENAEGQFIQFVDADDWIEPNCLELAYNKIVSSDADVVWFEHLRFDNDILVFSSYEDNKFKYPFKNKKDIINNFFLCWDKMYKKSFIDNNNIKFIPNLNFSEDLIFCMLILNSNPKIEYLPDNLYNYRINEGSLSHDDNNLIMAYEALNCFVNLKEYTNASNDFKLYAINSLCNNFYSWYCYYQNKNSSKKHFKQLYYFSKKIKKICNNNLLKKTFYYKKICKILNFYHIKLLFWNSKITYK